MAAVKHLFVKGLDNERGLELLDNEVPLTAEQVQAFTRFSLSFAVIDGTPQTFTSTDHPEIVRYDAARNRLLIEAGGLDLAPEEYQARLVGFSDDQSKGIMLVDFEDYEVTIRD